MRGLESHQLKLPFCRSPVPGLKRFCLVALSSRVMELLWRMSFSRSGAFGKNPSYVGFIKYDNSQFFVEYFVLRYTKVR